MRKLYLMLIALLCFAAGSFSQVTIAGSTGTANGIYPSFTNAGGAFAALNTAGSHNPGDVITIAITADVLTEAGTNSLNAGTWASITVTPTGARTISGTTLAAAPLAIIDFNGADNVTFNGLNSAGNSLTIANLSTLATSGTCTIRFIGGATNNTITNCAIQGSGTMSVATNGATIFFSTDALTAGGNDNNTISNNDIGPAGANLPTKAILGNGSTTTTAIGNSGNVITNNDIHDYFGAAVTSAGIATNGGCNTWTITNNRFYQTGTRTWTTGALHNAINIGNSSATSGAQGFTITGNIVGYASNTQTGTYTLTGSSGTFRGIVFNGITLGGVSNINSNTVASVSVTGVTSSGTSSSAPFIGLYITNGVAITNSNTIGSQSATGSLVYATTSASAADMMGIFNFSVDAWTANTNNIGGLTSSNAGAGAANAYGIRLNTGSGVTTTLNGNNVGGAVANSIQSTSTATATQVAGIFVSTSIATVSNNTIRNLTAAGGTGTTTAASVVGINFISATPVNNVTQNTIFNLSNTNAAAATIVTGIQFTGGVGNVVQRNLIYDLTSATTSITAEVNGIRVAGGTTIYRNNMIRLGGSIANAIGSAASNSGTTGINGINEALGTNSFFHNSIYLEGIATAGLGASYTFNGTQTVNTRSFRDNIFFNARSNSGATGKHYAVKINGTVPNPTGLTINNNIYFANGTGATFGFFNSLDVTNLAGWKTAVGQDAGSFESNPQYNAPGAATPDLHLHPTNATVAEGNGVDVGVTDDYDTQARASFTPVDIGADAGNYTGIDLAPPSISYTALPFSCNTADRALNGVTITDVSGVPTSGVLQPRIYYRKNAGAWFSSQGTLASGTATNGTWDFTIVAADMGGLTTGDNVQYYVIAQDIAPASNIASNPAAGLVATDVNTVATAPTTPNNYNVVPTISGTYTVGAAGTYPTLTAAFNAYNTNCLGGPVVFSLIDAAYTITSDTLRANSTASSTNTLTIRPAAAGTTISGNLNGPVIVLLDADYITIDGSSAGASAGACDLGGNAAIRDLTITNTNVGTSAAVISIATGVNGAQNNTVKNVNILGQDPNTTLIGIAVGGNTLGTTGADNDNITIDNCSVRRSIFGIYNAGISAANRNTGSKITHNDLSATTTNRIKRVGIMTFNNDGIDISYNNIGGIETTESADAIGIALGSQGIDNSVTTSGEVVNALVANNKINGVASLSATGFSAAGITVAGGNAGANTIRNNMITGVTAPATSPDLVAGIFVLGAAGSNTQLYYNSVSMTGDRGAVASQMPSFGLAVTGTDPVVDLRNNILYTTQTASGGGAGAASYAIGTVGALFANLNSNYNAFWSTGANDGGFRTGSLGISAGTSYATLALWAAAVADDANSVEVDPGFVNPLSDLHINPAVCTFKGLGTPITTIIDDYDCNGRSATTPDIGADEFNPAATPATTLAGSVSAGAAVNQSVKYTVSGTTDYLYTCDKIIATINPAGGSPVSGNITTGVRVDTGANKMGSGELYAARFYAIEPVIAPATSTARITLYYLQSEFDNYNLKALDSAKYDLPTGPADALGISRLVIRQFHGTPTGGYLPGNYTGANEVLDPADVDVVWNAAASRWDVTVPVSSFSGFWLTSVDFVVPVRFTDVHAKATGATNTVYWTTTQESNNRKFIVERSTDGRNFTAIGEVATRALNGTSSTPLNYSFEDGVPFEGKSYYRLRQQDRNGAELQSAVVTVLRGKGKMEIVDVRPNPTTGNLYFNVIGGSNSNLNIVVRSINGKEVMHTSLIQGSAFSVNLGGLASGIYTLEATNRNGEKAVFKVVKQ